MQKHVENAYEQFVMMLPHAQCAYIFMHAWEGTHNEDHIEDGLSTMNGLPK